MNTPARLGLFGLGLAAVFGAAFLVAGAVVPPSAVEERIADASGDHGPHENPAAGTAAAALPGLSLAAAGYRLSPIAAPQEPGTAGALSFSILDERGTPLTRYTEEHEKDLHLIVVRSDGAEFRHVHPEIGADGTWSVPWTWQRAGSYRVFADFVPGDAEEGLTLSRSLDVGGGFAPERTRGDVREARAGDFDVSLEGDLLVGGGSTLTLRVSRDGDDVTGIQPYLGAFGHLVALREGDLAYLHVHPEGAEPQPGELSGPSVDFATEAPTAGRYLLYFDFRVGDEVHTAAFALTTAEGTTAEGTTAEDEAPERASHDESH
ncbi:heavy-metal-associated domain-containing protein [Leucobacter sp.]